VKIAGRIPATTLFDFMWRLRTRSDYREAESFLEGISLTSYAVSYHHSISIVTSATMATLEVLIVAYAGRELYRSSAQDFLHQTGGLNRELQRRLEAI
jgi:hypothetical protein